MKTLGVSCLFLILVGVAFSDKLEAFREFTKTYSKNYATAAEHDHRLKIFQDNLDWIEAHNKEGHSYTVAVNEFADLTLDEFHQQYLSHSISPQQLKAKSAAKAHVALKARKMLEFLPEEKDWTSSMNPVRDQGTSHPDAGFAHGAVAALEAACKIAGFPFGIPDLAEQELVDCVEYAAPPVDVWEYIIEHDGLAAGYIPFFPPNLLYHYTGNKGPCVAAGKPHFCKPKGHYCVPPEYDAVKEAVAQQPVFAMIDASSREFVFYDGGIFDAPCRVDNYNHAVAIVGYGEGPSGHYWKVRNSWGTRWGKQGYIYFARGPQIEDDQCGLLSQTSYPTDIDFNQPR